MIDIKELAIGNWVKFPYGIDKIIDLPYVEGKGMCASFAASATLFPVPVEDLEPIEITPEILEKNGFEFHSFMSDYPADYVLAEDYYSIIVNEVTDGLYQFKIFGEEIINTTEIIHASYIHQLQNALTLCGIDKEIKL